MGIVEIRGFGRCERETKINYIAIARRKVFVLGQRKRDHDALDRADAFSLLRTVDHAVADLQLEVEDFLAKVAV
jgi:hypothetical protein